MTSPQTILGRFTKLLDLDRLKTVHSQSALPRIGFREQFSFELGFELLERSCKARLQRESIPGSRACDREAAFVVVTAHAWADKRHMRVQQCACVNAATIRLRSANTPCLEAVICKVRLVCRSQSSCRCIPRNRDVVCNQRNIP